MKTIRIKLLIFLVLAVFLQSSCSSVSPNLKDYSERMKMSKPLNNTGDLLLKVSSPQREYSIRESVALSFSLENMDTLPLSVENRFILDSPDTPPNLRTLYLNVKSPMGELLPFRAYIFREPPRGSDNTFTVLQPGEKINSEEIPINQYYDFTAPGKYVITGFYENYYLPRGRFKDVWRGEIQSEPVEFEVVAEKDTQ